MLRLLIVALVVTVAACGSALARLDASDLRDIASQVGKASAADKTNAAEPVPVVSRPSVGWLERPAPGVRRKTVIAVETGALVIVSSEEGVQVALVQRLYLALISQVDETDVAVIAALPETCALRECTVLEPAVITRVAHAALATRSGAEGSRTIVASNQLGKAAIQPEPDTEAKTDTGSHDTAANPPPDPLGVWLKDYGTFLLGVVGTLLAAITTWFTVAHIRHQIRTQPAAGPAASAKATPPAAAAPLMTSAPDPAPAPRRRRTRSSAKAAKPSAAE